MSDTECLALSAAAMRMRRSRQRRRDGLRCIQVELRETEIDALIRKKLLTTDARNDDKAVRTALYAHFDRTLGAAS
jgi:SOS response regulatory protein OraA/RecX